MATWFTDGCTMTNVTTGKYSIAAASYATGKGRFGTSALAIAGGVGQFVGVPITSNPSTLYTAFAIQTSALPSGNASFWSAFDATANLAQISLNFNGSGQLVFTNSSGTQLGSPSTQNFFTNTIFFLEIKSIINSSSGLAEVRLNGNTTPIISYTGNTQSSSNAYINQIRFLNNNVQFTNNYFSDIHIWDTVGTPNGYLGNKRVYTLAATADSASSGLNQMSTSPTQTTGNHFQNIQEMPPDGDTSYNYSNVAARESYRFQSLPSNAQNVVQVVGWADTRIDDAGPHTCEILVRSNDVDLVGATVFNPNATYGYLMQPCPTDPNTSATWTVAGVNAMEVGPNILS
jgi:hypothetical protein